MGASDTFALCKFCHILFRDQKTCIIKTFDQLMIPLLAVPAQLCKGVTQRRGVPIHIQSHNMDLFLEEHGGNLHPGDRFNWLTCRRLFKLFKTGNCVMVAECNSRKSGVQCIFQEQGRRIRAIRCSAVCM